MNEYDAQKFKEKMGDKVQYGVCLGKIASGKTTVCKMMEKDLNMNVKVIDMKQIRKDNPPLDPEGNPIEGEECKLETVEELIAKKIRSEPNARWIFDEYLHPDEDAFFKFLEQFGCPDYILFLDIAKQVQEQRYKTANEVEGEELPEEHAQKIIEDKAKAHTVKQDFEKYFADKTKFITITTDGKQEEVCNELRSKFAPKLVLINHEKALEVDTVCSNLALKYNMLYLSVYQLIKEHVTKKTELGIKLTATKKVRKFNPKFQGARDNFDERGFSPVHYDLALVT